MEKLGLLPTPQASTLDGRGGSRKLTKVDGKLVNMSKAGVKYGINLEQMAKYNLLPTPQARDFKGPQGRSYKGISMDLPAVVGATSQLNPLFVMEMMGFPPDWTELPFLSGETNQ